MSFVLPVLFHWAPASKRRGIVRYGLLPGQPPTCMDSEDAPEEYRQTAVCLGTSPSHAWSLSGDLYATPGDTWDLWQMNLDDNDLVIPLPFEGFRLQEIRVANRIHKRRVWYVASRVVSENEYRRTNP